jgi:hypothetical protein
MENSMEEDLLEDTNEMGRQQQEDSPLLLNVTGWRR